ncbi:MAG: hypothetical protein E7452_06120 [Ruminococcaceae bacterium]|nr:hypothetical protein [Oscillospiraceae bacterium]
MNVTYQAGEHEYLYRTDAKGRIVQVWVELLRPKTHKGRLRYNPRTLEKLPADHAAHLIGDQFGGSNKIDNLISMYGELNTGDYLRMERFWRQVIDMDGDVSVKFNVSYDGDSKRPSGFMIEAKMDGISKIYSYKNTKGVT